MQESAPATSLVPAQLPLPRELMLWTAPPAPTAFPAFGVGAPRPGMALGAIGPGLPRDSLLLIQQLMSQLPRAGEDPAQWVRTEKSSCPLRHHFAPGLWAREILMPAGHFVVGAIHRHSHINVIAQGRCRVVTEFGSEELCAPAVWVSAAGTKRVVQNLETTVWVTVHFNPDDERDIEILEARHLAADYEDLERRAQEKL